MSKNKSRPYYPASERPKRVDGQRASRTDFYKGELRKIIKGLFDINCPLDWDTDYLLNYFISAGYIIISDTVAGILPIKGSLTGFNYADNPTEAVIAVPILGNFTRTIGVDCELVFIERKINRSYYSFNRMIDIYAEKLASADAAIDVNLMNSKLAYIAEAETKAQADTIRELYDTVSQGEPLVVYRKDPLVQGKGMSVFFGSVKNNYIADMVQDTKRTIINEMLTLLGINNANTDKRERLITNEVEANNVELEANISLWRYNLDRCVKRVKKVFPGLEFNMTLRFDPKKLEEDMRHVLNGSNNAMGNESSGEGLPG